MLVVNLQTSSPCLYLEMTGLIEFRICFKGFGSHFDINWKLKSVGRILLLYDEVFIFKPCTHILYISIIFAYSISLVRMRQPKGSYGANRRSYSPKVRQNRKGSKKYITRDLMVDHDVYDYESGELVLKFLRKVFTSE